MRAERVVVDTTRELGAGQTTGSRGTLMGAGSVQDACRAGGIELVVPAAASGRLKNLLDRRLGGRLAGGGGQRARRTRSLEKSPARSFGKSVHDQPA